MESSDLSYYFTFRSDQSVKFAGDDFTAYKIHLNNSPAMPYNQRWEMALKSLYLPSQRCFYIPPDEIAFKAVGYNGWQQKETKSAYVTTVKEVFQLISNELPQNMKEEMEIKTKQSKTIVIIKRKPNELHLGPHLAAMLGFKVERRIAALNHRPGKFFKFIKVGKEYKSYKNIDLNSINRYIFVETNCVRPHYVGNKLVSVVAEFVKVEADRDQSMLVYEPKNLAYFPLTRSSLNGMEIVLKNEMNQLLKLCEPLHPVVIELHFRRKTYFTDLHY